MKWPHYLILFLILSGGGYAAYQMTRGLRNKNPGNLRYSQYNDWNGQTGQDSAGFVIFSDAKYGIRAMGKTLDSYQRRGVSTIAQIIATWAPSVENDTQSYIRSVVSQMGASSSDYEPSRENGDFVPLVKAIIKHENGLNPYNSETIETALNL